MPETKPRVLITPMCGVERDKWLNPSLLVSLLAASHDARFDVVIEPAFALSPIDHARNHCIATARDRGFDWNLQVDNDMILPPSPFFDVLGIIAAAGPKQDVIGLAAGISLDAKTFVRNSALLPNKDGVFTEVERIGAGVLAIRKTVWEKIPVGPWFRVLQNADELGTVRLSEDLFFCQLVRSHGLQMWQHTIASGHLKTVNITPLIGNRKFPCS